MPNWDPGLYLSFGNERTQPAIDLAGRIELATPGRIMDLGCGPGNSTEILRARWPGAEITGLDNSAEMIASASSKHPDWNWVIADVQIWEADRNLDLIFSNAALQWVPDHGRLIPRLMSYVASGGALAVQMPAHFQSPVHQLILQTAGLPEWRERTLRATESIAVGRPSFYYELLRPNCSRIDLWETEYNHVLDGPEAIVEWVRATALRPYLEALECDEMRAKFIDILLEGLREAYPGQSDGKTLFPFRRLFIVAYQRE